MIKGALRGAMLTCLTLAVSSVAFSQKSGSPGITAPIPTFPRPISNAPIPNSNPNNGGINDVPKPNYVAGKVILDDGTPPPEPVLLQIVCSGSPRPLGYTDTKGRFSIDLNNRLSSALYADASDQTAGAFGSAPGTSPNVRSSNMSSTRERSYLGCDVQAALAGFRSERVSLADHRSMESPDIGSIVLRRLANVEGLTISATSALAPKDARKAFEKGLSNEKSGKWDRAAQDMQKAVDVYPKFAAAWFHLGLAQQHQDQVNEARKSYAKSLEADSRFVSPYQQLATLAARENKWEEVESETSRLLRLNAIDFPEAWFYNAVANYNLMKLDAAEKAAQEGLAADSQHRVPRLDQIMGVIQARKENYADALVHMSAYLKLAPEAPDSEQVKKQIAVIEKRMTPRAAVKN